MPQTPAMYATLFKCVAFALASHVALLLPKGGGGGGHECHDENEDEGVEDVE